VILETVPMARKKLTDLVDLSCDLEPATVAQYMRAADKFGKFLQKEAEVKDLTEDKVNAFLADLRAKNLASVTVQNYRTGLMRLWNLAADRDLITPVNPRRIRKIRVEQKPVKSWSMGQIKLLLAACNKIDGKLHCDVPAAAFLGAWIRVGYDTGLRPVDLRLLRWCDVDLQRATLAITQHKTKRCHTARLSKNAVSLLEAIEMPPREKVFPLSKSGVRRLELLLFQQASKLGFRRSRGQGLGVLRKTHATQIYELEGDYAAAESLGHVGGVRTVRKSYIDSRSLKAGRLPPDPPAA